MRKFIFHLIALLLLIPNMAFAEFTVNSDYRTFDIVKGIYDLKGNVFVQFPVHDTTMTITGNETKVFMYKQEVHGTGNIKLSFGDLKFSCDKVDVFSKERTAYLEGNMKLITDTVTITSDSGSYCWKTKIANFNDNVYVNGQAKPNNTKYNMETKSFIE